MVGVHLRTGLNDLLTEIRHDAIKKIPAVPNLGRRAPIQENMSVIRIYWLLEESLSSNGDFVSPASFIFSKAAAELPGTFGVASSAVGS